MSSYRVLFVCMGNICRSPAAECVFRHRLAQTDLDGGCGQIRLALQGIMRAIRRIRACSGNCAADQSRSPGGLAP